MGRTKKVDFDEIRFEPVEEKSEVVVKYVKSKATKLMRKVWRLNVLLLILFLLNLSATVWAAYSIYRQVQYNYEHRRVTEKKEELRYLPQ